MANPVPKFAPVLPDATIKSGLRVLARDWETLGEMQNYLIGSGGQAVVANSPSTVLAVGDDHTYRYYLRPRRAVGWYAWFLFLQPAGTNDEADVEITSTNPSAGGTRTHTVRRWDPESGLVIHLVPRPAFNETEFEMQLNVVCPSGSPSGIFVRAISCIEVPRSHIADDTIENGADISSLGRGSPIYDGEVDAASITGLLRSNEVTHGKRTNNMKLRRHQVHWSVDDGDALTTTSATYTEITLNRPICLGRLINSGQTVTRLAVRVRARLGIGDIGTGNVKLTMTNGDSVEFSIGWDTSFLWANKLTLDVDTEDLSAGDGRRGAANDVCKVEIKTSASTTLSLSGISIYDDGAIT